MMDNAVNEKIVKNIIPKRNTQKRDGRKREIHNKETTFIYLPFIEDDLTRKINAKVRSSGLPIKIAWQRGQTVPNILVR